MLCRAADDGIGEACAQLGKLYYSGSHEYPQLEGFQISPDIPKACMWFHLGGWYGSVEADRIAKAMTADELEEGKRLFQEWSPGQCDNDIEMILGNKYSGRPEPVKLCKDADKGSHQAREDIASRYFFGFGSTGPN
jgi:TPR repeat protein